MRYVYISLAYIQNLFFIKNNKKLQLNFLSNNKIINICLNSDLKISKNLNYMVLKCLLNRKQTDVLFRGLENFLKNLNNFYISKLNFSGKGFKIKKIKDKCYFLFNKSHKVYLLSLNSKLKKISKSNIVICQKNRMIWKNEKNIKNVFIQNIFTRKGIRNSAQLIKVKKK